jgi:hypothetical protein
MTKLNPLDTNFTDGCIYNYSRKLSPEAFNYSYYFECGDGKYTNITSVYNNLEVSEVSWYEPQLINPQVSPIIGNGTTLFNYTVWYFDGDNNLPIYINVTIDTSTYLLVPADLSDINATDGILYYYNTTLSFGFHQFQMNCSDMSLTNATNWINTPEVNPFYGISSSANLLTPTNGTTFFNGWINFTWTSLNASFGSVNYTIQISNVSDFSFLMYENTIITETSTNTSAYTSVDFPTAQYYWRVRPTYNIFNGSWSENFTFIQIVNDFAPTLTSGGVDPLNGSQYTVFNFTVEYTDQDNNPPVYVYVVINGSSYAMTKLNPLDTYQWQFLCYD